MFYRIIAQVNLKHILLVALLFRVVAAFWSKGFAFSDDHYEVVELAQKWREGIPFIEPGKEVYLFSLFYPGLHYLLFDACNALGITDPQSMMLVVRLFHALVSLLTVYYGYLLALRISGSKEVAVISGLLLAVLWFFPFMSVRSLREFFCIPFLMAGSYYLANQYRNWTSVLLPAFFFALAVSIRLQCVLIPAAAGLLLFLSKKHFQKGLLFGFAFLIFFGLTHGLFDYLYYGNPVASIMEYMEYNSNPENIKGYPQGPWYRYIGTVAGMLLGLSFFPLVWGYGISFRLSYQHLLLFIASLFFFAFHSYYPNKQERFITPFIPYFIILGVNGFYVFYNKNKEKKWLVGLTRFTIIWFVILNTAGLLILSFSYSKRSRVESMSYLYKKADVTNIVLEGHQSTAGLLPFYLGKRLNHYTLSAERDIRDLETEIQSGEKPSPNYLIMTGNMDTANRLKRIREVFPGIRHEKDMQTGFLDNIAHRLNPKYNKNESWFIYRIK